MRSSAVALLTLILSLAAAFGEAKDKIVPIAEIAQDAVQHSQLTLPGSPPFHLKVRISEVSNASSEFKADVEEYWVSPEKWRRTIQSSGFSQLMIVSDHGVFEQNTGDYYPWWLRDLVTALVEPLPMLEQIKRLPGKVDLPGDSIRSTACFNLQTRSGAPPAQSNLQLAFCFRGQDGLLKAISTPGYRAEFQDYKPFLGKQVARRIVISPRPGTTIAAEILELQPIAKPDEQMFVVDHPTPPAQILKSVEVGEDTARRITVDAPEIKWPAVRSGKVSGLVTLYISADRSGHVREAWLVSSDNAALTDAAREQVMAWRFQPYVNGFPMQMESVLTFAFSTKIENPIPLLTNDQVRKLASRVVEARVPAGASSPGKSFTLRISVDEAGKILAVQNPNQVDPRLFTAGERVLRQWQFRPYIHSGKPDRFDADVTFKVR
jgi:hypothetical protein